MVGDAGSNPARPTPADAIAVLLRTIPDVPEERGRVYFLVTGPGVNGPKQCKIGKTRSDRPLTGDATRIKKLIGQSPVPLVLAAELEGYTAVEKWLHARFAGLRQHGEWFKYEGELRELVEKIKAGTTARDVCATAWSVDQNTRPNSYVVPTSQPEVPHAQVTTNANAGEQPVMGTASTPLTTARALFAGVTRVDTLAERVRRSFATFMREAWHIIRPGTPLVWGPHLDAMCMHTQRQLEERARAIEDPTYEIQGQKLGKNVPPRTGKTLESQVFGTAWAWLLWPELSILCVSANGTMLNQSAREFREIITSDWYKAIRASLVRQGLAKDWAIKIDQDAITDTGNTAGGSRRARPFGAAIIGLGSDWMIIDDPHNADDSEREVESAIATWDTSLGNRINDPRTSIMTLIMQRLRENDLAGHFKKAGDWHWLVITMEYELGRGGDGDGNPTIYGWNDWRKKLGEVIHPRFTVKFLISERTRLGSYGYAGQMQQRPAPLEGGRIKRMFWGFCRLDNFEHGQWKRPTGCDLEAVAHMIKMRKNGRYDLDWCVLSVDAAAKKTTRGSNYGLGIVGGREERVFVLDDRSQRGDFPTILKVIRSMILDWHPHISKLLIEGKAAGGPIMETLTAEVAEGKIKRIVEDGEETIVVPIEDYEPDGEFEARVDAVLPKYEAKLVHVLEGAKWASDVVEEHALFPNGTMDDRIDMITQAIRASKAIRKNTSLWGAKW